MNVTATEAKSLAAIIGSVAVTAAVITVAVLQGSAGAETFAGDMSTGVTVTASAPPSEASVPAASPEIKGPAPLPVEEQGLPG